MQPEIEAKFLDVDIDAIREKLDEVGATLVASERLMRRKNFDIPGKDKCWVRVRDEAGKITLTYKQQNDRTLTGTHEINLEVNSFKGACEFLKKLGMTPSAYQETKRESWRLGDVEIEIDTWPWLDPFVEIEAPTEDAFMETTEILELDVTHTVHGSVEVVYARDYDVTEAEVIRWPEITFIDVPTWLEEKRKKHDG